LNPFILSVCASKSVRVTSNFVPEETLDLLALGSSSWLKNDKKKFCK